MLKIVKYALINWQNCQIFKKNAILADN